MIELSKKGEARVCVECGTNGLHITRDACVAALKTELNNAHTIKRKVMEGQAMMARLLWLLVVDKGGELRIQKAKYRAVPTANDIEFTNENDEIVLRAIAVAEAPPTGTA